MKHCSKCGADESTAEFTKTDYYCRSCRKAWQKAYMQRPEARASARRRTRKWQKANPDKVRAKAAEWAANNPEKKAAHQAAWYRSDAGRKWRADNRKKINESSSRVRARYMEDNPEMVRSWRRAYYARHRDAVSAHAKARRAANPEQERLKSRLMYKRHRDKRISEQIEIRAKRAGAVGSHTVAEWKSVLRHQKRLCFYCHKKLTVKTVSRDHRVPLCRGGRNDIRNIVAACRSCNSKKHTMTTEEYLSRP